MGTFSKSLASCGGFIAGSHEVIDFLRISSRAFLFTAAAVPAAVGAALAALRIIRSDEGPPLFARVLENAAYLREGLRELGFKVLDDGSGGRRRSSPCSSATTGRPSLLWRALYDAGVYVNVALHPAVPPAGALLRTSVMATHDRAVWTARWSRSHRSRPLSRPSTDRFRPRIAIAHFRLWRVISRGQ